jgi:TusA-related sulfurtransferase
MKIKSLVLLVKLENGQIHQVLMDDKDAEAVISFIVATKGKISVLENDMSNQIEIRKPHDDQTIQGERSV